MTDGNGRRGRGNGSPVPTALRSPLHVVTGASGGAGKAVVAELKRRGLPVRAIARSEVDLGVPTVSADLTNLEGTVRALEGASHVYVCVGLPYRLDVWKRDWPVIMSNLIGAAGGWGAPLVFLDNIYMYGVDYKAQPLQCPITEDHPIRPPSKKGLVRKAIATELLCAHKEKRVQAVIARAADFYGPGVVHSPFYEVGLKRMIEGQRPQWIGNPNTPHSYAYMGDQARAMVDLALAPDTYGDVWHLPVAEPAPTTRDLFDRMGRMLELPAEMRKPQVLPKMMLSAVAPFMPVVREVVEIAYQEDHPYVFNWSKFKRRFPEFTPTPYDEGIKRMVDSFRGR